MNQAATTAAAGQPAGIVKSNPNLFYVDGEVPGGAGLKGTHCADCGRKSLLAVPVCHYCGGRRVEAVCIGRRARLVRFSVVEHPADGFAAPYVIGEIATDEGPTTYAPILRNDGEELHEGQRVRFTLLHRENEPVRFAFAPEGGGADAGR